MQKSENTKQSETYSKLRNKRIFALRVAKQAYKVNNCQKNYITEIFEQRLVENKSILGKDKMEAIPPLIQNGQPINDPNDKYNAFNQYFQSQTELDDINIPVPELPQSNFFY